MQFDLDQTPPGRIGINLAAPSTVSPRSIEHGVRPAVFSRRHPGTLRLPDANKAVQLAREPLNRYLKSLVRSASDWTEGASSKDYPGYDKIIAALDKENFESQVAKSAAWVGTPDSIARQIEASIEQSGGYEIASLQVNFNDIPHDVALESMRLFSREVMPRFR